MARRHEALLVALLMGAAGLAGGWYHATYGLDRPFVFRAQLGPAVAFALGDGLVNAGTASGTKLEGFLTRGAPPALSREDVPRVGAPVPLNLAQRTHLYLLALVGVCWWIFGVSWASLAPLMGALSALSVGLAYALIRLGTRAGVAALGASLFFLAPNHIALIDSPRDYAKTPVFLAVLVLLGVLLTRPMRPRGLLAMGALLGAVIGVGYGIRQDVGVTLLVLPPLFLVFLPGGMTRQPLAGLGATLLAAAFFLAFAAPMLWTRGTAGDTTSHHVIGGLFRYNEEMMGVGGAPYLWHNEDVMTDGFIVATVEDFSRRELGRAGLLPYSVAYERAARAYWETLFAQFPADVLTRAYGSARTIASDGPWLVSGPAFSAYDARDPIVAGLQRLQRLPRLWWNAVSPGVCLLALLLISARSLRLALACLGLLIFFAGYPSIQFQARHFAHLCALPILAAALLGEGILQVGARAWRRGTDAAAGRSSPPAGGRRAVERMALFALLGAGLLVGPLWALRWWQDRSVGRLFERYGAARLVPATDAAVERTPDGRRILRALPAPPTDAQRPSTRDYLALRIEGSGPLPERVLTGQPLGQDIRVRAMAGEGAHAPALVFFPVGRGLRSYTVEVQGGDAGAGLELFRVADQERFPVLMTLVLPDDRSALRAHKVLTGPVGPFR